MTVSLLVGGQRRDYEAVTAGIVCVRYRMKYGISLFEDYSSVAGAANYAAAARVLHEMLYADSAPGISELETILRDDTISWLSATLAIRELMKFEPVPGAQMQRSEPFDELRFLGQMAACGLSFDLLYEIPILLIANVMIGMYREQSATTKWVRMSPQEVMTKYHIKPGRE